MAGTIQSRFSAERLLVQPRTVTGAASRFCPRRTVEHNALPDTLIVVELFEKVDGPRLTDAGITTLEAVAKFSTQTFRR